MELTEFERNFIENALNHYWNDANWNLTQRKDLGDIEKICYENQLKYSKELLIKFEKYEIEKRIN